MKKLAKWYVEETGVVYNIGGGDNGSVRSAPNPGKLTKIADCESAMMMDSKYQSGSSGIRYADVYVEVPLTFFLVASIDVKFLSELNFYICPHVPRCSLGRKIIPTW